jgi:hypothetical protein
MFFLNGPISNDATRWQNLTCIKKQRLTMTNKYSLASSIRVKGQQNKSLLNMNIYSYANTNATLRDTTTNCEFRIDTNAYVNLVNADSQTYSARYLGLSLSFCFSPDQKDSKHSLFQMFKDGRYSLPQTAVFTGYSSTSAAEDTCISIHQRLQIQTRLNTVLYLEKNMNALL